MTTSWSMSQEAAILSVLERMIENGESARAARDMLTGEKRMEAPRPWDGLSEEMQRTYQRNEETYQAQVQRAKEQKQAQELSTQSTERNEP